MSIRQETTAPPKQVGHSVFVDTTRSGELLVARARTAVALMLFLIQWFPGLSEFRRLGVPLNLAVLAYALITWRLVSRRYRPWMSYATGVLDVTGVSVALTTFALGGQPIFATNSLILFEVYLLVIAIAGLRFSWPVSAVTSAMAILQYGFLLVFIHWRWDLSGAEFIETGYGSFHAPIQIGRLTVLAAAGMLSVLVALRARHLLDMATTDHLTRLSTRGVFRQQLEGELARAKRYKGSFAVAIVDVDAFKQLNDSKGHASGDAALVQIAQILKEGCRHSDIVARYAGDEFALLLRENGAVEAARKLDALRKNIEASPFLGNHAYRLTISAGFAVFPDDGSTETALIAVADRHLYRAKDAGRNRVSPDLTSSEGLP